MYGTRYQTDEEIRRENRRLQDEIDYQRAEHEREQEQHEREQERQRRERQQQAQEAAHTAYSWPEAFHKNRLLIERERNECICDYGADDPEGMIASWDRYLAELDRATAIWKDEQRLIDEAVKQMRLKVAARLRAESENAHSELAGYIEDDDIDSWMNW